MGFRPVSQTAPGEDYPNLIFKHDFQAEIKEVRQLENKAEVDLELKNAAMNGFPWSIVLLKERNEWKICDVTTVKE